MRSSPSLRRPPCLCLCDCYLVIVIVVAFIEVFLLVVLLIVILVVVRRRTPSLRTRRCSRPFHRPPSHPGPRSRDFSFYRPCPRPRPHLCRDRCPRRSCLCPRGCPRYRPRSRHVVVFLVFIGISILVLVVVAVDIVSSSFSSS